MECSTHLISQPPCSVFSLLRSTTKLQTFSDNNNKKKKEGRKRTELSPRRFLFSFYPFFFFNSPPLFFFGTFTSAPASIAAITYTYLHTKENNSNTHTRSNAFHLRAISVRV